MTALLSVRGITRSHGARVGGNVGERLMAVGARHDGDIRGRATTFSGGEQQRVNIARGFAHGTPAMLLDEPTASLDAANREVVLMLIEETRPRGAAITGIFRDEAARARVCDREIDVGRLAPRVAA